VSLEFLAADGENIAPIARSPMERRARAAGARFEVRDGWNVAVGYASGEQDARACAESAGWVDVSHLGKLELQASPDDLEAIAAAAGADARPKLGSATRAAGARWCPLTDRRALILCERHALPVLRERLADATAAGTATATATATAAQHASLLDVSTVFAAMTLVGPLAREIFARFCAIDLRPGVTPVGGLRPGSIARQPGIVLCEADNRFLFLFGWAVAEYMWTVVEDAGRHLGARPVGVDALAPLGEPLAEMSQRA
jgi:glycine cleavage system aminomethyltransferase T